LIIWNSERSSVEPSISQVALKILWRQCSELACANIMSSMSLGSRPRVVKAFDEVVDLVVGEREAERGVGGDEGCAAASLSTSTLVMGAATRGGKARGSRFESPKTTWVMRSWRRARSVASWSAGS
jgi:hypothetical protein